MRFLMTLPLISFAACASLTGPVRGRVVDETGRPIAGAEVKFSPRSDGVLHSNAAGEFEGEVDFRARYDYINVIAVDGEHQKGGITRSYRNGGPVTIVTEPLTRVTGRVNYDKIPKPLLDWGNRSIRIMRPPLFPWEQGDFLSWETVDSVGSEGGDFEFFVPPGRYLVQVVGPHQSLERGITVDKSQKPVELGMLEALPVEGQEIYGTSAPELRFADARGIAIEGGLAALRGKWVLLYLWDDRMQGNAFWLPPLISFYNEHPKLRDRFEVVGIHNCDDVLTVSEVESARIFGRTTVADRTPIPFPMGIDDNEKTFNAYGMVKGWRRSSPRWFLVNPEGVVEFTPGVYNLPRLLKSKLAIE